LTIHAAGLDSKPAVAVTPVMVVADAGMAMAKTPKTIAKHVTNRNIIAFSCEKKLKQ
jgi:hypothetical protein